MAQQDGDFPSTSGTVVFVAATTITESTSSATTPDIFWAETSLPTTQDFTSYHPHTTSVSGISTTHGLEVPTSNQYTAQQNSAEHQAPHKEDSGDGNHSTIIIASITTIGESNVYPLTVCQGRNIRRWSWKNLRILCFPGNALCSVS